MGCEINRGSRGQFPAGEVAPNATSNGSRVAFAPAAGEYDVEGTARRRLPAVATIEAVRALRFGGALETVHDRRESARGNNEVIEAAGKPAIVGVLPAVECAGAVRDARVHAGEILRIVRAPLLIFRRRTPVGTTGPSALLRTRNHAHILRIDAVRPTAAAGIDVVRTVALVVAARVGPAFADVIEVRVSAEEFVVAAAVAAGLAAIHTSVPSPLGIAIQALRSGFAIAVGIARIALRPPHQNGRHERRHAHAVLAGEVPATKTVQRRCTRLVGK